MNLSLNLLLHFLLVKRFCVSVLLQKTSKFSFLVLDLLLSFLLLNLFGLKFFNQFDMFLCFSSLKLFLFSNFLLDFFYLLFLDLLFFSTLYLLSLFLFRFDELLYFFCSFIIFGISLLF